MQKILTQAHSLVHNLKGLAGNLEATDLQAAAVEMEKLVKGDQKDTPSNGQLDQKFRELEKAINQALEAVQTLGHARLKKRSLNHLLNGWQKSRWNCVKEVTDRIKAAAEMGDVMQN